MYEKYIKRRTLIFISIDAHSLILKLKRTKLMILVFALQINQFDLQWYEKDKDDQAGK